MTKINCANLNFQAQIGKYFTLMCNTSKLVCRNQTWRLNLWCFKLDDVDKETEKDDLKKKRMFLIYYTGLQPMLSWKRWTKSIQHFAVVCFLLQILSKHYNLNCTKETLIWIENAKSTWNVYVNNELVSGSCCIHVCS